MSARLQITAGHRTVVR